MMKKYYFKVFFIVFDHAFAGRNTQQWLNRYLNFFAEYFDMKPDLKICGYFRNKRIWSEYNNVLLDRIEHWFYFISFSGNSNKTNG